MKELILNRNWTNFVELPAPIYSKGKDGTGLLR